MRHGSLESGLGGFDYAAEMLGWENVFHCEISTFCQTVLKYYWPNAESFTDIFEFDGTPWRGKVDIISAGFPCQPFSNAGKRKGSADDRHIWPENMRIFREIKPRFIVAENVPGLLTIENGMVFETVCSDLENEGYEVQAFIIPACAKDAVHRRDRVWIVAHLRSFNSTISIQQRGQDKTKDIDINGQAKITSNNNNDRLEKWKSLTTYDATERKAIKRSFADPANTGSKRQQGSGQHRGRLHSEAYETGQINRIINGSEQQESWLEAATRLCGVDDEFAGRLDVAAISKSKWRTESLKAYGNAIYWPITYEIFKSIEKTELNMKQFNYHPP